MILDFDKTKPQKKHISGQGESSTPDHGSANATDLCYRNRAWCGALFDKEHPPQWDEKQMEYLCYSPEICPETKNFHYQWYVYFKNPKMLKAAVKYMQKHWSPKATIGSRGKGGYKIRGTPEQNRTYCGADDYLCEKTQKKKTANPDFKEFGKLPKQGDRKDLKELTDSILEGKETTKSIKIEDPMKWHQYGRTLQAVEDLAFRKKFRTEQTQLQWIYGPKGCGKTHKWKKDYDPETCYQFNELDNGFWCGYEGQETVIIDEFRGNIPYKVLLQLADDAPYFVKGNKGGNPLPFISKKIIITSALPPWEIYKNLAEGDSIEQIMDRIELIPMKGKSHRPTDRFKRNMAIMRGERERAEKGGEGRTA